MGIQDDIAEVERLSRELDKIHLRVAAGGLVGALAFIGASGLTPEAAAIARLPAMLFAVSGLLGIGALFFSMNATAGGIFSAIMRDIDEHLPRASSGHRATLSSLRIIEALGRRSIGPVARGAALLCRLTGWGCLIAGGTVGLLDIWRLGGA